MEFFRQIEMISRRGLAEEPSQRTATRSRHKETGQPAVNFRSPRNRFIAVQFETAGAEAIREPQHGKTQSEL
jgi:hypothetical protein